MKGYGMEQKKVLAKTEEEFIKEVAFDCLANMRDEDKEYIKDNPCSYDYHFGYALYIRNHYILSDRAPLFLDSA